MSTPLKISDRTLENLEWPLLQAELARYARTSAGRGLCQRLRPGLLDADAAQLQAQGVLELAQLRTQTQLSLPLNDIPDVKDLLARLFRQGQMSLEEFAHLARFHKSAQGLATFLVRQAGHLPKIRALLKGIEPLETWARETFLLLDSQGDLVDSASEDLRALRKLSKDLHEKIKRRLDEFLQSPKLAELMQDFYITVRDGRYVLPIKSNFKGRVPGIIHDVSHTEATLFIEPEEIVDWNNQLKVAEKEIQKEIERILDEVVVSLQPHLPALLENFQILARADFLAAACELSLLWRQGVCAVSWGESLHFEQLYHPLLVLKKTVVSNTLTWDSGLVLTGPNTGGKTVLLKSVGLALTLVWAGLPVPAVSVQLPPHLKGLFADIGDDQDLGANLSTFSGHLLSINHILNHAGRGDLVLIDEIATGTAPEDGQPLAQAILEQLLDHEVHFLVTTHYGALKQFAMADDRCRIAAMAFDSSSRQATYEVIMDIPGESSAFETAENLGLDKKILARARALRGEVSEDLDKAIRNLEEARRRILSKEADLAMKGQALDLARQKAGEQVQEYRDKQAQGLSQEAKDILRDLTSLRNELSQRVKSANAEELKSGAHKLFTKISDGADLVRKSVQEAKQNVGMLAVALEDKDIYPDAVVEVENLGIGVIAELPKDLSDRAQIMVQVGDLRTRVSRKRLRKAPLEQAQHFQARKASMAAAHGAKVILSTPTPGKSGSGVCDVRGKSLDDAMRRIELALNDLLHETIHSLTIIHGHGSDRLKESVRDYISKRRDDLSFRPGSWPGEGGDGVTVVEKSF